MIKFVTGINEINVLPIEQAYKMFYMTKSNNKECYLFNLHNELVAEFIPN